MILKINTNNKFLKQSLGHFNNNGVIHVDQANIPLVSNLLAEYVINNIDDKVITRIISREKDIDNTCEFKRYFYKNINDYMNRKLNLYDIISDALKNMSFIDFEGFIKFRLNDYYKSIKKALLKIKKSYFIDREYENFIFLIKEILKSQTSIVSHLQIFVQNNGEYKVCDEYHNDITKLCLNDFIEEFDFKYVNKDDFLFSTIINLAPRKISIHNYKKIRNSDLVNTLVNIYSHNLVLCDVCELCRENN